MKPSLSELERFEEAPEGIDIELPTTNTLRDDAASHSFSTGDNVIVCEGELIHLQGKILTIDGNMIMVQPKHDVLKVRLLFTVFIYFLFTVHINFVTFNAGSIRIPSKRIKKALPER